MYESFYGFRERPFDLTPNPRFLLLTAKHREALSNLEYGLTSRRGLTLLIGDAGTGKTTLIRAAMERLQRQGAMIAYLNNPTLTRQEFMEFLTSAFHLSPRAAASKTVFLSELAVVLSRQHAENHVAGLVIDEVQALPNELLEEVRLLANIETATDKLLPIVLAGQPELSDRLNDLSLRQLKQRVALRCTLTALDLRETAEYIAGRIRVAGGNSQMVFTRQAVEIIFARSGGIPRLISVICDNALISGFAADRRPVGSDIVLDVCRDFDLRGSEDASRAESTTGRERPVAQVPAPGPPSPAPVPTPERSLFQYINLRRRFSLFGQQS